MTQVGLIGFGYWGPNLARNFFSASGGRLAVICDSSPKRCAVARKLFPGVEITTNSDRVIGGKDIDAVVVAVPVSGHFNLVQAALREGKHVWVEKPMTATLSQAMTVVGIAEAKKLVLMVDHTFLFTGAVRKIKELLDKKQLGRIYYYDSVRVNLGLFQHDVNVIWDLAPHDLSILDFLIGPEVKGISALARCNAGTRVEDTAYLALHCEGGLLAHFHLNWLSPVKIRRTVIGGSKKMILWDDQNPDEKMKVYDKGVRVRTKEGLYKVLSSYRTGGMQAPALDAMEALSTEVDYFLHCIANGLTPHNDGRAGARIIHWLETADRSLKSNGAYSPVESLDF